MSHDPVNHPAHYTGHPSGVECITITECFNFNVGNAIKYLWRAGLKGDAVEDLKKAQWYVAREIERVTKGHATRENANAHKAEPEATEGGPAALEARDVRDV